MENSRKHLKVSSIVVLIFAVANLLEIISALCWGDINRATIPEGAPDNVLLIAKIILLAFSVILLIPNIYIGIKGLLIAKKPNSSVGHIILAFILLAGTALTLTTPIINIVNQVSVFDNIGQIAMILLEVIVLFDYIKYARAVMAGK